MAPDIECSDIFSIPPNVADDSPSQISLPEALPSSQERSPGESIVPLKGHRWTLRDRSKVEKAVNVLTCAPFLAVAYASPKQSVAARRYAASVMGVGVVAGAYHASGHEGRARNILRWADHIMVAVCSLCLSRALVREDGSHAVTLLSVSLLPVKPQLVTALHWSIMEKDFHTKTKDEPSMKEHRRAHNLGSLLAAALLVADKAFPKFGFLHSIWHVVAAFGMHTAHAAFK